LNIVHGLAEAPIEDVAVSNLWTIEDLERSIDSKPSAWNQMLVLLAAKHDHLVVSPEISNHLEGHPYHHGIAERTFALMEVLQNLALETQDDQSFTPAGIELWQKHSVGEKAWFTDESDPNKHRFRSQLTFRDPETHEASFCPWHGKIKINQFRIHFEWPRPHGQKRIKVLYIGPKITKA